MILDRARITVRLLAVLAALGLLLAACGDDADSGSDDASTETTAAPTDDEGDDAGATCETDVCMEGIAYTETAVSVAVGDDVTWTNLDGVPHTVTSGTPEEQVLDDFDSGNIEEGESFDVNFPQAGEFPFFCKIHPQMQGVVTVQ